MENDTQVEHVEQAETSYERMKRLGICPHCYDTRRVSVRVTVDGFSEWVEKRCPYCSDPNAWEFWTQK